LSPRRINELLEPELPEVVITDEDVDFPDTESPTNEDEQEGNEKQKGEESEERDEGATDKAKRKRIHHGTANRAALADFAKQVIPVLLNAPEGTTKEQIYDKAREISITFCEDHPDLAMEFRVPEMELKPDPRIAELTEETAKLKTLVRHQRDQISGLERGNGELNREIAVLRGRDTKAKPATD
jgi:hypothetical protein